MLVHYFYANFVLLLFTPHRITDPQQKENLGIIVQYKVKVKLALGPLGGDVVAELPFILMHPKPEETPMSDIIPSKNNLNKKVENNVQEVHTNLIQLE